MYWLIFYVPQWIYYSRITVKKIYIFTVFLAYRQWTNAFCTSWDLLSEHNSVWESFIIYTVFSIFLTYPQRDLNSVHHVVNKDICSI